MSGSIVRGTRCARRRSEASASSTTPRHRRGHGPAPARSPLGGTAPTRRTGRRPRSALWKDGSSPRTDRGSARSGRSGCGRPRRPAVAPARSRPRRSPSRRPPGGTAGGPHHASDWCLVRSLEHPEGIARTCPRGVRSGDLTSARSTTGSGCQTGGRAHPGAPTAVWSVTDTGRSSGSPGGAVLDGRGSPPGDRS